MRVTSGSTMARGIRSAFTLVELLVVIVIITVVISLVLPAVGAVRRKARVTISQQVATNVANAASTFENDKRRLPGFYSVRDMGVDENAKSIGMPSMLNVLLDLSGGVVSVGLLGADDGAAIRVAPYSGAGAKATNYAWVNPDLIGSPGAGNTTLKGYFTPDKKFFYPPRANSGKELARFGTMDAKMPDLVDAFGTPYLAWVADETLTSPIAFDNGSTGHNNFVRLNSDKDNPSNPAMFYWASNAAYLKATSLGRLRTDQTTAGTGGEYSLIGSGNTEDQIEQSLTGILGNPGFYTGDITKGADYILPSAPRGKFIVHGADPDGFYFEAKDGGKAIAGSKTLKFGYNYFLSDGTTVRKDDKGQVTSTDVIKTFGDIMAVGGS